LSMFLRMSALFTTSNGKYGIKVGGELGGSSFFCWELEILCELEDRTKSSINAWDFRIQSDVTGI
jgi:hypothetical protein